MKQKLEIIKDLARKIMSNSPSLFRFNVENNDSIVVLRFFDIKDNEVYGMQGTCNQMIEICNFVLKNKRKRI